MSVVSSTTLAGPQDLLDEYSRLMRADLHFATGLQQQESRQRSGGR
jgi:hypothetical protein